MVIILCQKTGEGKVLEGTIYREVVEHRAGRVVDEMNAEHLTTSSKKKEIKDKFRLMNLKRTFFSENNCLRFIQWPN